MDIRVPISDTVKCLKSSKKTKNKLVIYIDYVEHIYDHTLTEVNMKAKSLSVLITVQARTTYEEF